MLCVFCIYLFRFLRSFKVKRWTVPLDSRPSCQFCFYDHIQYFDHWLIPAFKSGTALFYLYSGCFRIAKILEIIKKNPMKIRICLITNTMPQKLATHVFSLSLLFISSLSHI